MRSLRIKITSTDFSDEEGDVPKKLRAFRSAVWNYWKKNGRHDLPWRRTKDPYKILVSEVMLQQTQVPRVSEKYKEFLKAFPNVRVLARAPLSDVLRVWSGLGYSRRAKFLRDAAKIIVGKHGGRVPLLYSELVELPGIGPYTASAVLVFAFNLPDALLETNIRTALIYNFAAPADSPIVGNTGAVHDIEILPIAQRAAWGQDPRKWHWALMDYGAYLKRMGVRNNSRSAHYTRQSKFEGSLRQVRGAILRSLANGPKREPSLQNDGFTKPVMKMALERLARDGLIVAIQGPARGRPASGRKWRIA